MLVPQGDGDGGEVEAGGAEATTESRGEAGGAKATTESRVEAEGHERERDGNDAPCLEARQVSPSKPGSRGAETPVRRASKWTRAATRGKLPRGFSAPGKRRDPRGESCFQSRPNGISRLEKKERF